MSNNTQNTLLDEFNTVAGSATSGLSGLLSASQGLTGLISNLTAQATAGSAVSQASGGGSGGVLSVAKTVLESGLGLAPLIGGLIGLFEGSGDTPAPTLLKYAMPSALSFEMGETGGGIGDASYDQMGMPRTTGSGQTLAGGTPAAAAQPSQITVNVQAMDARSFMDRSSDIAAAVRYAMLNLNSINDVVSDL